MKLSDPNGASFSYTLTDSILKRLHEIDGKAKGYLGLHDAIASNETRNRYVVSALIEEAITSSQLEGAATTRKVAVEMLRTGRKPVDKHEQMILNNFMAMRQIHALVKEPLSLSLILHLHRILTEDTLDAPNDAGRIQTTKEERIKVVHEAQNLVLHVPPAARLLPKRLEQLIDFAERARKDKASFIHPILQAVILHFMLGFEHPFVDGNGRVARALFYWSALKSGYRAFEFISISQIIKLAPTKYGNAFLYTETDNNDLTYFIDHQLDIICRALEQLEIYIKEKQDQRGRIQKMLPTLEFNHRQLVLISHAVRHASHVYTIRSHKMSHNVAYATARSDLMNLADREILIARQIDRKTIGFVSPENIEDRLSELRPST